MAWVYNSQLDAFELYHLEHDKPEAKSSFGSDGALPALGHAVSGAAGTAVSKVLLYPLDLVITRLQVQSKKRTATDASTEIEYTSVWKAIEKIYNEEGGIGAFYEGLLQDTGKSIADSFLLFLAYNFLFHHRQQANPKSKRLPVHEELAVGMIAGAFARFWTAPIQQVVTRKQTASLRKDPNLSTKDIASEIYKEKGILGFWSGYSATLVLTLNPSLTFFFQESLMRALIPRSPRSKPSAAATFLIAAASKAMASTITYPFSLAKSRAQVSSHSPDAVPDVEKKKEDSTAANVAKQAERRAVFGTILKIAKAEGVGALYQGVGAEIIKGFFSHGLTMLLKERIHRAVIALYYLILRLLRRQLPR